MIVNALRMQSTNSKPKARGKRISAIPLCCCGVHLCFNGADSLASSCPGPALENREDPLDANADSYTRDLSTLGIEHTHQSIIAGTHIEGGRGVVSEKDTAEALHIEYSCCSTKLTNE